MLEVHAFILAQEKETNKVFIKKLYMGQKSVLFFVFKMWVSIDDIFLV